MEINEWLAKECGAEIKPVLYMLPTIHRYYWENNGGANAGWDYKDPRCMAVIREHFKLCTDLISNDCEWMSQPDRMLEFIGMGKSPHLAEIACVEEIFNKRGESDEP